MLGEIQEETVGAYLETACRAFAESDERKAMFADGGYPGSVWQFLELALNYVGVNVENMTVSDAREVLLEIFPRKVSMDANNTDEVIDELTAFWRFCDRVHGIQHAASIADGIEKIRARFRREMRDPANFGMAKGFFIDRPASGFRCVDTGRTQRIHARL